MDKDEMMEVFRAAQIKARAARATEPFTSSLAERVAEYWSFLYLHHFYREGCVSYGPATRAVAEKAFSAMRLTIESLQAQLEKSEKGRLEGVELYNKYIVLCHEKSKRLHELEAQLAETRLERNMQEANKNHYKAQLSASQRREKAAVGQRDCMSCYNRECQEYRNETAGGCPEWRGPQEAGYDAE